MAIVTPIIHPNGDSTATLTTTYAVLWSACLTVEKALLLCTPTAKNYAPEPGRLERALAQHRAREGHLRALMDSLLAEILQLEREIP